MTIARSLFQLGNEISPIIMVGGIAQNIPGQMLPIVAITEAANFTSGLLSGSFDLDLDQYLCHFEPLPGGTLVENSIGSYPFANQTVAANAIIAQPLHISLKMSCPVKGSSSYVTKFVTISALKAALDVHNNSGGTYIVATPAFIYESLILKGLRDISGGDTRQVQTQWQWDFERPLLTLNQADQVLGNLMNKIDGGLPITTPSWSGAAVATGSTLAGATSINGASSLTGTASALLADL
jgi:hypothetical protein